MSNPRHTLAALSNARHTLRASVRTVASALLLGVVSLAGACSDTLTSPEASRAPRVNVSRAVGATTSPVAVQALLRSQPLAQTIVVSKKITPAGGTIEVPGADFTLEVPKGAVSGTPVTVTITAYSGYAVAYDFQPHGVAFRKALKATQGLQRTTWKDIVLPAGFAQSAAGAYFADPSQVDFQSGRATVNEFMATGMNVADSALTWDVPHFSGYIVSWGIQ